MNDHDATPKEAARVFPALLPRLCLIFVLAGLLLPAFVAQPRTFLDNPAPPRNPPIEEDDEQLLTLLLSDKSRNLHQWGAVTQFHGLPSDRVNAIAQTSDGILWFGTDLGLAKFDGRRVQTVTAENFFNPRVLVLRIDAGGTLWIGTSRGAFIYAANRLQPLPETAGKTIAAIAFDPSNNVYLGSGDGFVDRINPGSGYHPAASFSVGNNQPVKGLVFYDGWLLIGTEEGLYRLDGDAAVAVESRPRPANLNELAVDGDGRIWLGTDSRADESGLLTAESPDRLRRVGHALGTIAALHADGEGRVWAGTADRGAFHFRNADELAHHTFENTAGGLRSNEVLAVFVDRENVVWFGTGKGVSRYDPNSPSSERFSVDLNSKFIRTLYQDDDGKIYAGTKNGLFVSEKAGVWNAVAGFERKTIYSIAGNGSGKLLVGSSRGLNVYAPAVVQTVRTPGGSSPPLPEQSDNQIPAGSIRAIQNFEGRIYLAVFGQGLLQLTGGNPVPVPGNFAAALKTTALKADAGGRRLWVGTAGSGAFYFDGTRFAADPRLDELKNKAIWAIEFAGAETIWFATSNGLYLFENGELIPILPEIDVRAVALSAAGVWCATEKDGLMRVVRDPVFGWITSRLDVEQGLPSQRVFTLLKTDERTFLIGTNRGLVRYRMPDTRPILIPTRVLSRRLHGPEELSSPITLDFPQNTLTVEVAGISSRTFPEQFQYAFLLRNEEGELLQQRLGRDSQLLMNNLPPGGYALEIVALDKNLIASESRRIEFKVEKPPFPLVTLALTVLLLLALIALAWAIYSQRRIFQKSAELKSANRELSGARLDLVNEAERERRRISRDLHDQTLADLRHLQLLADKLAPTPETAETAQVFRREIENVSHEIRRICEDLTPSVLENIGFAAALEWALNNSLDTGPEARKFETEFRFDENLDENPPLAPGEQIQIYRIVQEVLNNIARHAAASKVKMSVEKRPDGAFRLEIEDDGKFFEPPAKTGRRGRGLSNISSRASLIEADISFTPGAAGGTIFTLVKAAGKNTVAIHNSLAQ